MTACNAGLFNYYANDPDYSDVAYLTDSAGQPLVEPGADVATAWVSFTYTDEQGLSAQSYEFDVCMMMPDGSTMIQMEFEGAPEVIEANLAAIEELAMGVDFGALANPILDNKGGGGLIEDTPAGESRGDSAGA